jgi:Bacterial Ig domain
MVLNSSSPRVFAEQGYYSCYGVSEQPTLNDSTFCALPLTNTLPQICIPEGDPITLTNYFYRNNLYGASNFLASPQDYPLSTTYSEIVTPGDPTLLPTQKQNYTYPLSVTTTQPSTTGSSSFSQNLGAVFTGNGTTGLDSFTYTITNTNGDSDSGDVSYKVIDGTTPVLEQLALPQAINTKINTTGYTYPNFGTNTVTIDTPPSHGSASYSAGLFSYTPNTGYVGSDSFTYYLTDSSSNDSSIQTVKIKVYDPSVSKVLAFNLVSQFGVFSFESFTIVSANINNGQELYYLHTTPDAFLSKKETHTYSASAPAVSASEGIKNLNLLFSADVTNDPEQLAQAPNPINDVSMTQPIQVEHKNTAPAITSTQSDYVGNSATISGTIADPENNNFDVIFEMSRDNFSTISDTFTLPNQTNGSFSHTFTGLSSTPYSYRIRAQEVGTIPNLCNTFSNSQPQSPRNRQSSVFPLRSSGGILYGTTNTISGVLIRTGGYDH